jgi:SAM-dependent methyltransferase
LPNVVFLSPKIEIFLNELRFYLLSLLLDEGKISEDHLAYALLEPIGRRSLNNEYVCYQTDIEQELVLGLQQAIDQYIKGLNDLKLITDQMLVLAMYMPLNALHPALADIDLEQWPKALHGLYKLSFANKNEGYPYPRWHSTHIRSLSISYLKAYPHLESLIEQGANFDGQINCLVAGCGTGKHAITLAKNTSDINVTALDFSIHSLTYAKQMAAEYKTGNIEFLHGDILDIPLINKQFNVIECVGVLHHMENPEEGLSTIVESLEHNGILALGLYSKIARREIRLLREANTKIVMQESIENIRDFRFELLSQGKSSLLKSRDFYSTSCCRDMMFLEPETQFTLLAIMVLLEKFHLNFLGFHSLDIKSIQRYRALFPNDVSLTSLENWHQFELQYPETFDQMYQFHCQKRK